MAYKKRAPAKKAITKRRAPVVRRSRPMRSQFDGMSGLCSGYFEITRKLDAGQNTPLSYTIKCDPVHCNLKVSENIVDLGQTGLSTNKGNGQTLIPLGAVQNADIVLPKFGIMSQNYLQYKINSIQIKVLVDKNCLDNPICFSTDKGDNTPVTDMAKVMSSAGKRYVPTDSKRQFSYGWKPSGSNEREFITVNSTLQDKDTNFLKVFQDMETAPAGGSTCTHRVEVLLAYTLKDSAHLN